LRFKRASKAQGRHSIEVNGYRGWFLKAGRGPDLVIIASPIIMGSSYLPIVRQLAQHFTVYVVETPGSGRAHKLKQAWRLQDYRDWLLGFFHQLNLNSAIVVGHSNSGPMAIEMTVAEPTRFKMLVLADSTGMLPRSGAVLQSLLARAFDSLLELRLSLTSLPAVVFNLLRHTRSFFYQLWLSARLDLRARLPDLRVITLIAWGGKHHTVPRMYARQLQEYIPSAVYATFHKGSHDWLIEYPQEFTRILLSQIEPANRTN
jgi:pimeloyl-ACP methyl ester carboxylesterase